VSDLTGRRVLVTGGGTGIGFGCAQTLLAADADVTIAGRRAEVLADAADQLGSEHGRVQTVACDITDEAAADLPDLTALNVDARNQL
jgi:NAD(P)-dependent dehydrogenase (short-subunit alcohol dehydrogenase family)